MNKLSFLVSVISMTICSADSEKPTADQCLGDTLSFRIEIPAGTKQKWEFNDKTGEMEKDYKDGKERLFNFCPTPEIMDLFQKLWRSDVTPSM